MKLSIEKRGRRWLLAIVFGVLAAAAWFYSSLYLNSGMLKKLVFSGLVGAAATAAATVRVELKSWWSILLMQICAAFVAVFMLHFVILSGKQLEPDVFANNMAISLTVVLLGAALSGRPRMISLAWMIFCWGFSMVDCAVVQFRGNLIALSDFYSIGTALSVVNNYRFVFTFRMLMAIVVLIVASLLVFRSTVTKQMKKWPMRTGAFVLAAVAACLPVVKMKTTQVQSWKIDAARANGILMEFLVETKLLRVAKPEGYSLEKAHALLEEYENKDSAAGYEEDPPHVIVVMVEALSDLSVVGEFDTSAPVMPFTDEFVKKTIHGYALSPVYGGGTSGAEWEFLTGNSNAFVPHNANVYRQFVRGEINSIVRTFDNIGYKCIAMHPFKASGWDRQRVYPVMGFEEIYFLPDLEWGETVRGYVSDQAYVEQVINLFENRGADEKLFLFGVTMQNHSGYEKPNFEATVHVEGMSKDYPETDQYLSLLQLTDKAIEDLITYFSNSDEKVQIVLFGDHQPRVSDAFYKEIGKDSVQDKFIVPYFLWKNYEEEAAEMPLTSLYQLPAMMMESMGIDMPAYYRFLTDLRETVPALNRNGYMIDGENVKVDDAQGEILEALNQYRMLQYANMFDKNSNPAYFIGKAE